MPTAVLSAGTAHEIQFGDDIFDSHLVFNVSEGSPVQVYPQSLSSLQQGSVAISYDTTAELFPLLSWHLSAVWN